MTYGVGSKYTQVIWQEDDEGIPEKAIVVTPYDGSGLVEIKQGRSEIYVNYESIPELMKAMKAVKGMRD